MTLFYYFSTNKLEHLREEMHRLIRKIKICVPIHHVRRTIKEIWSIPQMHKYINICVYKSNCPYIIYIHIYTYISDIYIHISNIHIKYTYTHNNITNTTRHEMHLSILPRTVPSHPTARPAHPNHAAQQNLAGTRSPPRRRKGREKKI
jgi:hypothetical protein